MLYLCQLSVVHDPISVNSHIRAVKVCPLRSLQKSTCPPKPHCCFCTLFHSALILFLAGCRKQLPYTLAHFQTAQIWAHSHVPTSACTQLLTRRPSACRLGMRMPDKGAVGMCRVALCVGEPPKRHSPRSGDKREQHSCMRLPDPRDGHAVSAHRCGALTSPGSLQSTLECSHCSWLGSMKSKP